MSKPKAVIILSGGMDSGTLLGKLVYENQCSVYPITFNYGQRHSKEIGCAEALCDWFSLRHRHKVINLPVAELLSNSSLLGSGDIPEGKYDDEVMKSTVVPNRNPIMANIALGYAINIGAKRIVLGIHTGDHHIYEDCRETALEALNDTSYIWSSDNRGRLLPSYVRAFFEAEGCFTSSLFKQIQYHRKTKKRLGVSKVKRIPIVIISQKDKTILEEIKKFFYGRGSIYTNKKGCSDYKLQWQDCRLMIDLMNGMFKTAAKEAQFISWYQEFKEMFEREVETDNPAIKGKTYEIQNIKFIAPFLHMDKGDIASYGVAHGFPYQFTWTCYKGGQKACGKCGACVERLEAFQKANMKDPLIYMEE